MDLLKTIERLQEEKRSKRMVPDHVLLPDLMNAVNAEVKEEVNELYLSGKIGVVQTVNSKAVYIK